MGANTSNETVVGEFKFDRETKNTVRYQRVAENGRTETIYVQKDILPTPFPKEIEQVVRW